MTRARATAALAGLTTLVASLGSLPAAAQTGTRSPAPLRGLEAYVEQAMRDWRVPGVAIAVVKNDSVIFAKGFGVRELGKPEPVDERSLFAIGSNTKAFTAAAIGMLVDEGKMRWDDPITRHIPFFQLYDPAVTREITLRDALSHRSGLGRRGDILWYGSALDRGEIIRRVRFLKPNSSFRSQYGYQNIMFLSAGEALATASGKSWDDFVTERIFRPLGMTASNTSTKALAGNANVAMPHRQSATAVTPIPYRNIDNVAPAGSINSNVVEMAQWIRLQLGGGTYRGTKLIEARTLAETHAPHTISGSPRDTLLPSTHFSLYGLGWGMSDYLGKKILAHTGGIDGMLSEVRVVPEEKLGLVILTNSDGHGLTGPIAYRIMDAFLGAPPRDWSAMRLAQFKAGLGRADSVERALVASRVSGTRPSLSLDQYAGTFADSMYGQATVTMENDKLVIRYGPAFAGDLEHWHYDTFRATWRSPALGATKAMIAFDLDARGKVKAVDVEGIALFEKAPERRGVASASP